MRQNSLSSKHDSFTLKLRLLGGASGSARSADRIENIGPGKPLALLAYLACSPGCAASRDHLIDLLWADHTPDQAKHALRQTVWHIRRRFQQDVLKTGDREVILCAPMAVDALEFLAAVEHQNHERAVALYTGDFLPDLAVPGGVEFEQWADRERFRLRSLFSRAAEIVVRDHLSSGRMREGEMLARRVRDSDRSSERGWRLLLESLVSAGDWVRAGLEADELERLLEERHRTPEAATRAAIQTTRASPTHSTWHPSDTIVAELVGRESEFNAIVRAWENTVSTSQGAHIHILAPAGLGKSRLLADAASRLRAVGASVFAIRANPGERDVPYAFISDVAAALGSTPGAPGIGPASASVLVGLNPSLSAHFKAAADTTRGDEALRRRVTALRDLLAAVSHERPVALLLDDLHWSDPVSRQIIEAISGRVGQAPVLLVTASRPTRESEIMGAATAVYALPPLRADQVNTLVESIATLPSNDWSDRLAGALHASTGGSPLLVLETLQLLIERGWLSREGNMWRCENEQLLFAHLEEGSALQRRLRDLPDQQRDLLCLLALAGAPVAESVLARAIDRPLREAGTHLRNLEKRGMVQHDAGAWQLGHDEIGEIALSQLNDGAINEFHYALGCAFADAQSTRSNLMRAARHLRVAANPRRLRAVLLQWIAVQRKQGNKDSVSRLVAELVGLPLESPPVDDLTKSLSLFTRARYWPSLVPVVGATLAVIAVLGTWIMTYEEGPPDASLVLVTRTGSGSLARELPLFSKGWDPNDVIAFGRVSRALPALTTDLPVWSPVLSPEGERWAFVSESPDTGGVDVYVATRSGQRKRLTFWSAQDDVPSWSPDGRYVAIRTSHWHDGPGNDLAIINVATREIKPLLIDPANDMDPKWSPDGSRIAFRRRDPVADQLCVISFAGDDLHCVNPRGDGFPHVAILGWHDLHTVVLRRMATANGEYGFYDIDSEQYVSVREGPGEQSSVDDRGQWLIEMMNLDGLPGPSWFVGPIDQPGRRRRIDLGGQIVLVDQFHWKANPSKRAYLASVAIQTNTTTLTSSVPHRMLVRGKDQYGDEHEIPIVSWRSDDTTVATIDSAGNVLPKNLGTFVLHATAGGWRSDSIALRVVSSTVTLVLEEDWRTGIVDPWVSFGDPKPDTTKGPGDALAFWNRGDDSFDSGVYSRLLFSVEHGLGVEALLSIPAPGRTWQDVTIRLTARLDSADLEGWDHTVGNPPYGTGHDECLVHYPVGRQSGSEPRVLSFQGAGESFTIRVDPRDASGRWFRLGIQTFPDGTCGVAIDGTPLARTTVSLDTSVPYRVVLSGRSVDTKVLVGPLQVWRGVRTDVPWAKLLER